MHAKIPSSGTFIIPCLRKYIWLFLHPTVLDSLSGNETKQSPAYVVLPRKLVVDLYSIEVANKRYTYLVDIKPVLSGTNYK